MTKAKKKAIFWCILLGILLAALLPYLLKREPAHNHPVSSTIEAEHYKVKGVTSQERLPTGTRKQGTPEAPSATTNTKVPTATRPKSSMFRPMRKEKVDSCAQLENDVRDFFSYLDKKPYVRHLNLGKPVLDHMRDMVRRLAKHPPVPGGEGIDPHLLIGNIYHLYRVLGLKDIRLIREVLINEQDSLEINLEIFYRWVMAGDRCPDRLGLRPSFDVLYKYAGFFVNTIGGRACLFRRTNLTRLLATYYCLNIVHEADKRGLNTYGLDIYPLVISLKNEISYYHDLELEPEYLEKLTNMETYYLGRR